MMFSRDQWEAPPAERRRRFREGWRVLAWPIPTCLQAVVVSLVPGEDFLETNRETHSGFGQYLYRLPVPGLDLAGLAAAVEQILPEWEYEASSERTVLEGVLRRFFQLRSPAEFTQWVEAEMVLSRLEAPDREWWYGPVVG